MLNIYSVHVSLILHMHGICSVRIGLASIQKPILGFTVRHDNGYMGARTSDLRLTKMNKNE